MDRGDDKDKKWDRQTDRQTEVMTKIGSGTDRHPTPTSPAPAIIIHKMQY